MTSLRRVAWLGALATALSAASPDGLVAAEQGTGKPSAMWEIERTLELRAHRSLRDVRVRTILPAPFKTDGCSGGLSDVWAYVAERFPAFAEAHQARPPWERCCVEHDRAYHGAGPDPDPERSYDNRAAADAALRACVLATAADRTSSLGEEYALTPAQVRAVYSAIGQAMFLAVRLGGKPCTGMPWRWGYGYPSCAR